MPRKIRYFPPMPGSGMASGPAGWLFRGRCPFCSIKMEIPVSPICKAQDSRTHPKTRPCNHQPRHAPCRRRENKPTISGAPTMTTTAFARVNTPDYKAPFAPYGCFTFSARKKWNGRAQGFTPPGKEMHPFPKKSRPPKGGRQRECCTIIDTVLQAAPA